MADANVSAKLMVPNRWSAVTYPPKFPGTMPAVIPQFSVSGVMSSALSPFGVAPAIASE